MAFQDAMKLKELPPGKMTHVDIGKEQILIANVGGKVYAIDNRCGHMNASLSTGVLKGKTVECPMHRARYDLSTGKCVRGPQMGGLTGVFVTATGSGKMTADIETLDQKTYKTKIEDGIIRIEIPKC